MHTYVRAYSNVAVRRYGRTTEYDVAAAEGEESLCRVHLAGAGSALDVYDTFHARHGHLVDDEDLYTIEFVLQC